MKTLLILLAIYIISILFCLIYYYLTEKCSIKLLLKNCPAAVYIPLINTLWAVAVILTEFFEITESMLNRIKNGFIKIFRRK